MAQEGIRLFQLNNQIKNILSDSFASDLWVVAEISEMRSNQNGHCYLELVEKDEETDQIIAKARATIWSYTFRMLRPYFETTTGQRFTSGIKVLVSVHVEFQEIYGYSLNIKDIDPNYTLGNMARRRREIIARLEEEGVLDMNKELDFPEIPKTIAIISSPSAAGYEDFVNQLENNGHDYQFHHKIFPAIMQGNKAEASIIEALDKINEYENLFDIVVIIRGGGSQADLNCFDNYWLAFNIAQFPVPIVSGIGHERDESIVDIVAHTSVKTPTAAAELLIDCFDTCREHQENLQEDLMVNVNEILLQSSEQLNSLTNRFSPMVQRILERKTQQLLLADEKLIQSSKRWLTGHRYRLESIQSKLQYSVQNKSNHEKNNLDHLQGKIAIRMKHLIENQKNKLSLYRQSIKYLNPENILQKGYTLTLKDGNIVKNIDLLSQDDQIETRFKNGSVSSKISNIKPKK